MVFNFRITCYGSARLDSGLQCSDVWMHEEKLLWRISSDVWKHIKASQGGEPCLPFPAFHSKTAWGNLDWVLDPGGSILAQIAWSYIGHNSCSLVPVALPGHHAHPDPAHSASRYCCTRWTRCTVCDLTRFPGSSKPSSRSRQKRYHLISVKGNLHIATLTCHRANFHGHP